MIKRAIVVGFFAVGGVLVTINGLFTTMGFIPINGTPPVPGHEFDTLILGIALLVLAIIFWVVLSGAVERNPKWE